MTGLWTMAKHGPKIKDINSEIGSFHRPYSQKRHFEEAGLKNTFLRYPGLLAEDWKDHKPNSVVLVTVILPENPLLGSESYVYEFAIKNN